MGLACGVSSKRQFPYLADEVVAEAVVRFARDPHIALLLVDRARPRQHAVRPQADAPVARSAREAVAFLDQPPADAEPACRRLDQQQTQLRYAVHYPLCG